MANSSRGGRHEGGGDARSRQRGPARACRGPRPGRPTRRTSLTKGASAGIAHDLPGMRFCFRPAERVSPGRARLGRATYPTDLPTNLTAAPGSRERPRLSSAPESPPSARQSATGANGFRNRRHLFISAIHEYIARSRGPLLERNMDGVSGIQGDRWPSCIRRSYRVRRKRGAREPGTSRPGGDADFGAVREGSTPRNDCRSRRRQCRRCPACISRVPVRIGPKLLPGVPVHPATRTDSVGDSKCDHAICNSPVEVEIGQSYPSPRQHKHQLTQYNYQRLANSR